HYPWYAEVQPVGWWLANHVSDGREELNFDEFGTYSPRRRFWKLNGIIKQLDEDEMPLSSYTLIHRDAILTPETKTLIVNWAKAMQDTMKNHYPADSLSKPQRKK
ncbi:MAG TPA: heme-binding domain-containing protein, partial [Bacteroidia bacterium]|nr:heme-binding domain-containing protein [Bacteroidia bacterium]